MPLPAGQGRAKIADIGMLCHRQVADFVGDGGVAQAFPGPFDIGLLVEEGDVVENGSGQQLVILKDGADRAGIAGASLSSALPADETCYRELWHSLSAHFLPGDRGYVDCSRSRTEWRALQSHFESISGGLDGGGGDAFPRALCSLAATLTGSTDLRTRFVRTAADSRGRFVQFPPAETVETRLTQLGSALRRNRGKSAAFDAMLGLVCLTNCHPFQDGNGRTGRILFNALLQRRFGGPVLYLPLFELAQLSRGGYIIRVRQAELRGNWMPLCRFVLASVRLWTRVVQSGETFPSASEALGENS